MVSIKDLDNIFPISRVQYGTHAYTFCFSLLSENIEAKKIEAENKDRLLSYIIENYHSSGKLHFKLYFDEAMKTFKIRN